MRDEVLSTLCFDGSFDEDIQGICDELFLFMKPDDDVSLIHVGIARRMFIALSSYVACLEPSRQDRTISRVFDLVSNCNLFIDLDDTDDDLGQLVTVKENLFHCASVIEEASDFLAGKRDVFWAVDGKGMMELMKSHNPSDYDWFKRLWEEFIRLAGYDDDILVDSVGFLKKLIIRALDIRLV